MGQKWSLKKNSHEHKKLVHSVASRLAHDTVMFFDHIKPKNNSFATLVLGASYFSHPEQGWYWINSEYYNHRRHIFGYMPIGANIGVLRRFLKKKPSFKLFRLVFEDDVRVYHLIWYIRCLEKNMPKMAIYPQMEKMSWCAWWVHILGVGRGPNKVLYHTSMPYQYQLLTLRQSKVMPSQNKLPKSRFLKAFL